MDVSPPIFGILGIGTTEIVFLVILLVLLFGVNKIPDLARSLGRAQKEFQRAREDVERDAEPVNNREDQRIRDAAHDLGIPTEGRTTAELKEAIAKHVTSTATPPAAPPQP